MLNVNKRISPSFKERLLLLAVLLLSATTAFCNITLPRLISDGMVLQRDTPLKLWGWASPKEKVTLTFAGKQYTATADQEGNWMIMLPAQPAGGPHELHFQGENQVAVRDVLFGDVWLCSGQSNIELTMDRVKYKYPEVVQQVNLPQVRQFEVPDVYDFQGPRKEVRGGQWLPATTQNILKFSAVGFFFARDLHQKYQVPIGLINAALGGSPAEAWMSENALKPFPAAYQEAQQYKDQNFIKQIEEKDRDVLNSWYARLNQTDEGLKNNWRSATLNDADWKTMNLPGFWADGELGNVNGVVWFRREVQIPASLAGKSAEILLGTIVDADSVFINGQFVGTTSYQYPPRRYKIPANLLKEGKNVVTVRVINSGGRGGFVPNKPYYILAGEEQIDLTGPWKYRLGAKMDPLPGSTVIRWKPTGLYNAMIAPLTNYSLKGVLWYQGESNAGRPGDYAALMKFLIINWRAQWNQGNFPFLLVQLPNFMAPKTTPQESNWAAMRQAQLETLAVPNTGMAVAIDAGEANDIHPLDKQTVGHRLALVAQRVAYGDKNVVATGPLLKCMKRKRDKLVLTFTNTGSGLVSKDGKPLSYFAIAGSDHNFVWAKAEVKGKKVTVWNDAVEKPVKVRYAWADNPEGANLYNQEGLPASPFEAAVGEKK
ncbi:sialate O-acetylesterase [Rufibacter quisquiliarum]|uniref:Sialate O-acetylesterase n=1 Tax=Rufibacter quisquiliarum TaxID=1549639 RepID=A0A839GTY5_9BACT|nr:sialate O-acetylesterase [Rufibacter quisquiliarum]